MSTDMLANTLRTLPGPRAPRPRWSPSPARAGSRRRRTRSSGPRGPASIRKCASADPSSTSSARPGATSTRGTPAMSSRSDLSGLTCWRIRARAASSQGRELARACQLAFDQLPEHRLRDRHDLGPRQRRIEDGVAVADGGHPHFGRQPVAAAAGDDLAHQIAGGVGARQVAPLRRRGVDGGQTAAAPALAASSACPASRHPVTSGLDPLGGQVADDLQRRVRKRQRDDQVRCDGRQARARRGPSPRRSAPPTSAVTGPATTPQTSRAAPTARDRPARSGRPCHRRPGRSPARRRPESRRRQRFRGTAAPIRPGSRPCGPDG